MSNPFIQQPSSYRDPSGFVFEKEGILYRQINTIYKEDYEQLISSRLYDKLTAQGLLVPHKTIRENLTGSADHYITLQPEKVPLISYAYEWSFDMLKDAALLTLQIQKEAMAHNMSLKDATPYNIQWYKGKLIFIDTLSFENYREEMPWIAYRQFCESFLSPLLLMHYNKRSLHELSLAWPEGIPLGVTHSLLPLKSRFDFHTYLHIHLHASVSAKKKQEQKNIRFSRKKMLDLVSSLETLVQKLKAPPANTAWSHYYEEAAQRNDYLETKKQIIRQWITETKPPQTAADLGGNDGEFAKLLAEQGIPVIATDFDPSCINHLYQYIKTSGTALLQPLIIDLSHPSPSIGVNNTERSSFISRLSTDLCLALALIHHLAIGKNIPFSHIAFFLQSVTTKLIIEFVPKNDPKVRQMLSVKRDIYNHYTQSAFETSFRQYFNIQQQKEIAGSGRTLYCMIKK